MISHLPEFDAHKYVHFIHVPEARLNAFVAIHRTDGIHPSFGATRLWKYTDERDALRDALRLARLMSLKSAHAGLLYGGAKAVIIEPEGTYDRHTLFKAYAKALNDLNGMFITGTDVGLTAEDVHYMKRFSRHLVGSTVDPTVYTAAGVIEAAKVTLSELDGNDSFIGKTFAIQGLGKIGMELVCRMANDAACIYVADIDQEKVRFVKERFGNKITEVPPADIHRQTADLFMPCALSASINDESIDQLQCRGIVGAANNQLAHTGLGETLRQMGILYAPDYVANAGGLISVVHEYEHSTVNEALLQKQVELIGPRLKTIFEQSRRETVATSDIANRTAHLSLSRFAYHV